MYYEKFESMVKISKPKKPIQKVKLRAEIWTFKKKGHNFRQLFKKKSLASKARNIFL